MRFATLAASLVLAMGATAALAQTAPAAAPAAAGPAHYSTDTTPIGDLLDDPAAKAILFKYMPAMAQSDQIDMARGMTLKDTQQYAPDMVSDATLAKIDAEFAKLPVKK